jgi:hypothetical protein
VTQGQRGDRGGKATRTRKDGVGCHAGTVPNGLVD